MARSLSASFPPGRLRGRAPCRQPLRGLRPHSRPLLFRSGPVAITAPTPYPSPPPLRSPSPLPQPQPPRSVSVGLKPSLQLRGQRRGELLTGCVWHGGRCCVQLASWLLRRYCARCTQHLGVSPYAPPTSGLREIHHHQPNATPTRAHSALWPLRTPCSL